MIKMLQGVSINNLKQMDSDDSVSISFHDDNGDKIVITSDVMGDMFLVQFINWTRFSMDNDDWKQSVECHVSERGKLVDLIIDQYKKLADKLITCQ